MGWRLDVSSDPVRQLELAGDDPRVVAVRVAGTAVTQFYDAASGARYEDLVLASPAEAEGPAWRAFLDGLRAPNGAVLAVAQVGPRTIHSTSDGRLRVIVEDDHGLTLDADGQVTPLPHEGDAPLLAVALDRDLGTIGAWSADGLLHLYQQHVYTGAYAVDGLGEGPGAHHLLMPDASGSVILVGPAGLEVRDLAGQRLHRVEAPDLLEAAACSPDGSQVATADRAGVIRVYDDALVPLRQQAAWDLLVAAVPLQLLPSVVAHDAVIRSLALADDGTLAFALEGLLCVSAVEELAALPQARLLL